VMAASRTRPADKVVQWSITDEDQRMSSIACAMRVHYIISVKDNDRSWFVEKRYSEFVKFDEALANSAAQFSREPLPPKGLLGLRHKCNIGGFNTARRESLDQYLSSLMGQSGFSPSQVPALAEFLGYTSNVWGGAMKVRSF